MDGAVAKKDKELLLREDGTRGGGVRGTHDIILGDACG